MIRADQEACECHYSDDERDADFRRSPVHPREVGVDHRRNYVGNVGKANQYGNKAEYRQCMAKQDLVRCSPVREPDQYPKSGDRRCDPK